MQTHTTNSGPKRLHNSNQTTSHSVQGSALPVLVWLIAMLVTTVGAAADPLAEVSVPQLSHDLADAEYQDVILLIAAATDLEPYLDGLQRFAEDRDSATERNSIYRDLGMRAYLLGDIEGAARYLAKAHTSTYPDIDSLLLAAHAAYLVGQYDTAQEHIQHILNSSDVTAVRQQALTVLGLMRIAAGHDLAAVSIFEPFRSSPEQVAVPELLYVLVRYELTLDASMRRDPGEYFRVLQDRFPDHPVTELTREFLRSGSRGSDGLVTQMPTPEFFLFAHRTAAAETGPLPDRSAEREGDPRPGADRAAETGGDAAQDTATDAAPEDGPRGIQVGSFGLRENAEHMRTDMEEAGFPVLIEEQQRSDRLYYSVIIPLTGRHAETLADSFGTADQERIYLEIRAAGYDGFRVY
ncbi:SPOR domain-containing protein [Spirochaeta africana]|uniref:Sporulation related protein n=1 Tax=Spirochaeta africana (strain ATCC 700263 / DSM 8902 / Z-7692) TaxID=889378 RepID=H9UJH8_SPIAZ|nr:SPOR domain-containing protein [Spirochaeta africana]AFG37671.1 sporulation related protein [Spirochaeta africana DSM 8902]